MIWNRPLPCTLFAILVATVPATAQDQELRSRVDSLFARWNEANVPGCAVGVDLRGQPIVRVAYGLADIERAVPWKTTTPGYIGSTSKQFIAFTVLLLAQRGQLSLDDDIRRFVPELPDYGQWIALRHLLHHTSGIRDFPSLLYYAGFGGQRTYGDDEIADMIFRQEALLFPPGTDVAYSTSGYWLLALAVERVTGKPWADFAREAVFGPLGMTQTFPHTDLDLLVPGRSLGYESAPDVGFTMYERKFTHKASLFMSVDDLLQWAANFRHAAVGGRTVIARMERSGTLASGDTIPEAPGLVMENYRGQRLFAHNGRNKGHSAELLRFPDLELSIAVLCNVRQASAPRLARRVADLVLPMAATPTVASKRTREVMTDRHGGRPQSQEASRLPNEDGAASGHVLPDDLTDVMGDYVRGENIFVVTAATTPVAIDQVEVRFNDEENVYGLAAVRPGLFRLTGPATDGTETIEFVPSTAGDEWTLVYRPETESALEFPRVPRPTDVDMASVAGSFHSSDLNATYFVERDRDRLDVRVASPLASRIFPRGLYRIGGLQWTDGAGTRIAFRRRDDGSATMTLSDSRVGELEFIPVGSTGPAP